MVTNCVTEETYIAICRPRYALRDFLRMEDRISLPPYPLFKSKIMRSYLKCYEVINNRRPLSNTLF